MGHETQIPDAVRRQSEEADKLLESVNGETETVVEETASADVQPEASASEPETPVNDITDEEEPVAVEESNAEQTPEKDDGNWENKFKSLKGRHQKEIKDLTEKVKSLTDQNMQLSRLISDMQSKGQTSQNHGEADESLPYDISKLRPEDFEDYGDEFKELVKANIHLNKVVEELKENKAAEQSAEQRQKVDSSIVELNSRIDKLCPNFAIQNDDADFVNSLTPAKKNLLAAAYADGDAETVAEIFNAYRAVSKKTYQYGDVTPETVSEEIAKQAQPTKNRQGDVPTVKTYTVAEIEKFSKDLTAGRLKMSAKDALKVQADMDAAIREGRITG